MAAWLAGSLLACMTCVVGFAYWTAACWLGLSVPPESPVLAFGVLGAVCVAMNMPDRQETIAVYYRRRETTSVSGRVYL